MIAVSNDEPLTITMDQIKQGTRLKVQFFDNMIKMNKTTLINNHQQLMISTNAEALLDSKINIQFLIGYHSQLIARKQKISFQKIPLAASAARKILKDYVPDTKIFQIQHNYATQQMLIIVTQKTPLFFQTAPSQAIYIACKAARQTVQTMKTSSLLKHIIQMNRNDEPIRSASSLYVLMVLYLLKYGNEGKRQIIQLDQVPIMPFKDVSPEEDGVNYPQVVDFSDCWAPSVVTEGDVTLTTQQIRQNLQAQQAQLLKKIQRINQVNTSSKDVQKDIQSITVIQNGGGSTYQNNQYQNQVQQQQQTIKQQIKGNKQMQNQKSTNINVNQMAKTVILQKGLSLQNEKMLAINAQLAKINTPQLQRIVQSFKILKEGKKVNTNQIKTTVVLNIKLNSGIKLMQTYFQSLKNVQSLQYPDVSEFPSQISTQIFILQRTRAGQRSKLMAYINQQIQRLTKLKLSRNLSQITIQILINSTMPYIMQKSFEIIQKPMDQIQIILEKGTQIIKTERTTQMQLSLLQQNTTNQAKLLKFIANQSTQKMQFFSGNFQQTFSHLTALRNNLNQNKISISQLGDRLQQNVQRKLSQIIDRSVKRNQQLAFNQAQQSNQFFQITNQSNEGMINLLNQNIYRTNALMGAVKQIMMQITKIKQHVIHIRERLNANFQKTTQIQDLLRNFLITVQSGQVKTAMQNQLKVQRQRNTQWTLLDKANTQVKTSIQQRLKQIQAAKKGIAQIGKLDFVTPLSTVDASIKKRIAQMGNIDVVTPIRTMEASMKSMFDAVNARAQENSKKGIQSLQSSNAIIQSLQSSNAASLKKGIAQIGKLDFVAPISAAEASIKKGLSQIEKIDFATPIKTMKLLFDAANIKTQENSKKSLQSLNSSQLDMSSKTGAIVNDIKSMFDLIPVKTKQGFDLVLSQKIPAITKSIKDALDITKVIKPDQLNQMRQELQTTISELKKNYINLRSISQQSQQGLTQLPKLLQTLFKAYKQIKGLDLQNRKDSLPQQLAQISQGIQTVLNKIENSGNGGNGGGQDQKIVSELKEQLRRKSQLIQLMRKVSYKLGQLVLQTFNSEALYRTNLQNQLLQTGLVNPTKSRQFVQEIISKYRYNTQNIAAIFLGKFGDIATPQVGRQLALQIRSNIRMVKPKMEYLDNISKKLNATFDF